MSLYHCGSILQPGRRSPGLQGVWCGENFPKFCADFHTNIDIQSVYWGLMANNRLDLMEPFFSHYHRIGDVARRTAREYYRMRGLRFPHGGSIGGTELCRMDTMMLGTDPCGSAWVGQLFWQFYEYTLDKEFLREVAYPILRDVALFYTDFVMRDSKSGKWTIAPVVHFEARHRPAFEPFFFWGTNSLWAQAFFRMGFRDATRAARVLGVDEPYQREWQEKLANLTPPPASQDGYWLNWENHQVWKPRAMDEGHDGTGNAHLLATVFPAELVSRFHGPVEWRKQAQATLEYYGKEIAPVWCGGIGPCQLLRLGEVDEAFRGARWSESSPKNGAVVSHPLAYFQVDHAPGMCRVLADMLVLGLDGTIYLFAGIPKKESARFLSLRAPGGFLITAEKRTTTPDYILIKPTADAKLKLRSPWSSTVVKDLQTNEVIHTTDQPIINVDLEVGREYLIAKEGSHLADLPVVDFASYSPPVAASSP
jgi:alpha-L-fucosidase 2